MVQNCFALKAQFMVNVLTVNYMQHSTRIYSLACCVRGTRTRPLISVRSPVQLIGEIF